MKLIIGYLYPELMNIYGDTGNIITLQKRAEWRGIDIELKVKNLKSKIKEGECDIYFFGGGQDQAQEAVAKDLVMNSKGEIIKKEVDKGVPLLAICGGYQLLGEYYQPLEGPKLQGTGLFPVYTLAGDKRMIGNIVIKTTAFSLQSSDSSSNLRSSESNDLMANRSRQRPILMSDDLLIGFENHSGKTYLKEGGQHLGRVIKGFGNNGEDHNEGCVYKNAVGCYMHGSLLPKNPHLADWFLKKALEVKYKKEIDLTPLDDSLEWAAHQAAISKFS